MPGHTPIYEVYNLFYTKLSCHLDVCADFAYGSHLLKGVRAALERKILSAGAVLATTDRVMSFTEAISDPGSDSSWPVFF